MLLPLVPLMSLPVFLLGFFLSHSFSSIILHTPSLYTRHFCTHQSCIVTTLPPLLQRALLTAERVQREFQEDEEDDSSGEESGETESEDDAE